MPNTINAPADTFNVTIDNNGGPVVDENAEINSLSIGATTGQNSALVDDGGFTLTVDQNVANNGLIVIDNASNLAVKGDLTNSGLIAFEDETGLSVNPSHITVSGTLTNTGTVDLQVFPDGVPDTLTAGTLVSAGNNTALITVEAGTTLTVTKELDITGGVIKDIGTLNGLGLINHFTGGSLVLAGQTVNITPAFNSGTLNIGGSLELDGTSLTVNGNITNSGDVFNQGNGAFLSSKTTDSLNVSGTFTNSGVFQFSGSGSTVNVGHLANTGQLSILESASLNLTDQPGGITDVPFASQVTIEGAFTAGSISALSDLQSVEGFPDDANGQSVTDTPGSGTLTIGPVSGINGSVELGQTWTVNGNVDNHGFLSTTGQLTVTGGFNNETGAQYAVGNVTTIDGTLTNSGTINVGAGGTLNSSNNFTTIASGSEFDLEGAFNADGHTGLRKLTSDRRRSCYRERPIEHDHARHGHSQRSRRSLRWRWNEPHDQWKSDQHEPGLRQPVRHAGLNKPWDADRDG